MKGSTILIIVAIIIVVVVGYFVITKKSKIETIDEGRPNTPPVLSEAELVENESALIANKNNVQVYKQNDPLTVLATRNRNQIIGTYTGQNTNYYYVKVAIGTGGLSRLTDCMVKKADTTTDFF